MADKPYPRIWQAFDPRLPKKFQHPDDAKLRADETARRQQAKIWSYAASNSGRARELLPETDGFVEHVIEDGAIIWDAKLNRYRHREPGELLGGVTQQKRATKQFKHSQVRARRGQGGNWQGGGSI